MIKGLKLVYVSAAFAALSSVALQGCGSDSSDTTPPATTAGSSGASGSGTSGNGGSSGSTSTAGKGGSSGSGTAGSAGSGTAGTGTSGNGGSSGSGTSGTGGQAGAGEAGAGSGGVTAAECTALTYPTPNPTCDDYCTTWIATCKGISGIPAADANKYADQAACLAACEGFTPTQMCCRDEHVHNAAGTGANAKTTHCPHSVGDGLCQN